MNIKERHLAYYKKNLSPEDCKRVVGQNWGKAFYEHLSLFNPKSVCDVGCGNGQFLLDLVTNYNCKEAYGVDIATVELDMVIKNDNVKYFSAEAHNIPLKDKSVDLVTAFDSLEHVSEDKAEDTLKELARISRKGFMFSITHRLSGEAVGEYNLHSCVKPKDWWFDLIKFSTGAKLEKVVVDLKTHTETAWRL
tara:strand:+ start:779 stop:1357 length:579 start_codon:yes stop_codon:yes gene_type:complete